MHYLLLQFRCQELAHSVPESQSCLDKEEDRPCFQSLNDKVLPGISPTCDFFTCFYGLGLQLDNQI